MRPVRPCAQSARPWPKAVCPRPCAQSARPYARSKFIGRKIDDDACKQRAGTAQAPLATAVTARPPCVILQTHVHITQTFTPADTDKQAHTERETRTRLHLKVAQQRDICIYMYICRYVYMYICIHAYINIVVCVYTAVYRPCGPELAQGHRVSRPRGTGSVDDSVGEGSLLPCTQNPKD